MVINLGNFLIVIIRFDKTENDHLYGYCSQSTYFESVGPAKRKRLNFGTRKYECKGQLYIHKSEEFISIMLKHEAPHQEAPKDLPDDLLEQIKEMSLSKSPGQIFKDLKIQQRSNEYLHLSLNQVRLISKKRSHIYGQKIIIVLLR